MIHEGIADWDGHDSQTRSFLKEIRNLGETGTVADALRAVGHPAVEQHREALREMASRRVRPQIEALTEDLVQELAGEK